MVAADAGHTKVVQTLMDMGAEIDNQDDKGRTALDHAALHGQKNIRSQIFKKMATEVNKPAAPAKDNDGRTAWDYMKDWKDRSEKHQPPHEGVTLVYIDG